MAGTCLLYTSRVEAEIEENDASIKALEEHLEDPEVAADYEAVTETSAAIAALHEKADKLLLNWTCLLYTSRCV